MNISHLFHILASDTLCHGGNYYFLRFFFFLETQCSLWFSIKTCMYDLILTVVIFDHNFSNVCVFIDNCNTIRCCKYWIIKSNLQLEKLGFSVDNPRLKSWILGYWTLGVPYQPILITSDRSDEWRHEKMIMPVETGKRRSSNLRGDPKEE